MNILVNNLLELQTRDSLYRNTISAGAFTWPGGDLFADQYHGNGNNHGGETPTDVAGGTGHGRGGGHGY